MGVSPVKSMAVGAGAEYREPFQDLLKCGCVCLSTAPCASRTHELQLREAGTEYKAPSRPLEV